MKDRLRRISRRSFLEGLGLAGVMMLAPGGISQLATWISEQNTEEADIKEIQPNTGSVLFGGWYKKTETAVRGWFEDQASIRTTFPEWESNSWGVHLAKEIINSGAVPLVSLIPYQDSYFYLSGRQQREFIINKAKGYAGMPTGVRLFIEANGEWYCYGNGHMEKERFLDGYRNAVESFRQVDPQAIFVYSLDARRDLYGYDPGDQWVDVNGLDGYNRATTYPSPRVGEANISFEKLFGAKIDQLRKRSRRPVAVTEFGVDSRNTWARQWFEQALETGPKLGVTAMLCFCENKENWLTGEANWDNFRGDRWRAIQKLVTENPAYYKGCANPEILLNKLRGV